MLRKIAIILLALVLTLSINVFSEDTPEGMVLVKSGTTSEENGELTVNKDFYIGKNHVTQSEFEEIMGFNPSRFKGNPDNPVERVSWFDAVMYCNRLSKKEGLEKYYKITDIKYDGNNIDSATVKENQGADGYRLLSEEEWEYAARGGKDGKSTTYAGSNNIDEVAWYYRKAPSTMPVGEKRANELGIYDMSGNVLDWTNTRWSDLSSVVRGGSWCYYDFYCEVDFSYALNKSHKDYILGFRISKDK